MGSNFDVWAYTKNVTDRQYAVGGLQLYSTFGILAQAYGHARTYGVQLRYRFRERVELHCSETDPEPRIPGALFWFFAKLRGVGFAVELLLMRRKMDAPSGQAPLQSEKNIFFCANTRLQPIGRASCRERVCQYV